MPIAEKVNRQLVEMAFASSMPVIAISASQAGMAGFMSAQEDDAVMGHLAVAGSVLGMLRLLVGVMFRVHHRPEHWRRWKLAHAAGAMASALLIGLTVGRAFVEGSPTSHMLATGLFFTYCGFAIGRKAILPWVCKAGLLVACAPTALSILVHWDPSYLGLAVLIGITMAGSFETVNYVSSSARRHLEREVRLATLAQYDELTGLPNRAMLRERMAELLEGSDERALAVHFVDLDHFKPANDRYGHAAGDAVLRAVGERLRRTARETDLVARLGGDEFVVVQCPVSDRSEADLLARRIVRKISEPFAVEGETITIGATVGVALAPEDGTDLDQLLESSDEALYKGKRARRGTVVMAGPADIPAKACV